MAKMMPVGPLMIEHRLIEKMLDVMVRELARIKATRKADTALIDACVDFIRSYADQCHHGKEEDILFRELARKPLSPELAATMRELIEEHKLGRSLTGRLVAANKRYLNGDEAALTEIVDCIASLADFYPRHIEKEDRRFFAPVMKYFTPAERDALLEEGFRFDQGLIHRKYKDVVAAAGREFDA